MYGHSLATMEATLAEASTFKRVLASIKDLITETNFDCSSSGIALQSMDSSHVCLVSLLMRPDGFEAYNCPRPMSLGISLAAIGKIMQCSANDEEMTLLIDAKHPDLLNVKFGKKDSGRRSTFELKLMDIQGEALGIPDMEYGAKVTMASSEFQRICRDLTLLGDTVKISVNKTSIEFATTGESGSGKVVLSVDNKADTSEQSLKIDLHDGSCSGFALRYLVYFTKATALSSTVTLTLTNDQPIIVQYDIDKLGYIRYFLAPKVEEDVHM